MIIIVGGDGFIGWPLALRLSARGHAVHIIDNLVRRQHDCLTQIKSIEERLEAWFQHSSKRIAFTQLDVSKEYETLVELFKMLQPTTIIHLGEQRSAPYSMKNQDTRRYTVQNNLLGTHNILNAILDTNPQIHLVHIGSMGVYGYGVIPDTVVPEGNIHVQIKNQQGESIVTEIPHPTFPGSVYHMTKSQDALFFQFYAKNYKLRITDLHQGIVWGAETRETALNTALVNLFDYDSDYGTVLNRFMIQVVYGLPLTVYGTGHQTRAFINIENSLDCIELAVQNPPTKDGQVKIFNQVTETHTLIDLATLVQATFPETKVNFLPNPRNEQPSNHLQVANKQFLDLGLQPVRVSADELIKLRDFILKNKTTINENRIPPISFWNV